ncbi:MAG: tetratricopeptide repeat protein [Hyphomicrobiales bacterium]
MADPFDAIRSLLKSERYAEALEHVYDRRGDRIRAPFHHDLNRAWYIVADIFFKQDLFARSKTAFERSLLEHPNDVEALLGFAHACAELHHYAASERALRLALEENPFDDRVLYSLANILFDNERYEEAISLYERLISVGSRLSPGARKNLRLAVSQMRTG